MPVKIGINELAHGVSDIYVGADGKARKVAAGYIGVDGKAEQFYSAVPAEWKFTVETGAEFDIRGKNLVIDFGDGAKETVNDPQNMTTISHTYGDSDPHQVTVTGQIWGVDFHNSHPEYLLSVDTIIPKNKISSFDSCFYGCTSLTAIPAGLFDNCTAVTSFDSCFYGCTSLTGLAPELWDTTRWPNVTQYYRCFYNCTGLSNYAAIPSGWK